jgi:predicted metal-dependent hydrolase
MMSVFTVDDASAHTTLSNVEARLADLHQANIDQNKVIAQQNAKIESMQQEHERQLATLRQEQASRLDQLSHGHQEHIERLSEKQDRNTSHITEVMRDTLREYMEAQMKAIIAEVAKTQISTPNNVDINTQTTVSSTTQLNTQSLASAAG